ncbi:MAG: integrase core domain-containing protein [Pseudomonadota bacterium]|nr:integrase core domain-containing protein [Pseudomonadota bacterium]
MNAHCERFNRSLQESFVDDHEDLLFTDLALFNEKLADWIVFYKPQLPHLSTKPNPKKTTSKDNMPMPPGQYLLKPNPQCNRY